MNIKVSVVDDQNLFRKGVVKILSSRPEISVVNELQDGSEFVAGLVAEPGLTPHVVLLDHLMPEMDGIAVCSWLQRNRPHVKPIIVSQFEDEGTIRDFVENGAVGYLLKTASVDELVEAVKCVYERNFYFNDLLSNDTLIELLQTRNIRPKFRRGARLTPREREVVELICDQKSYKEIAADLKISQRTVESHKNNVMEKIGATKVAGIVLYAAKRGWK